MRQMARLRVALRVPVGRPLPGVADFVARCEDAGFDGVGIHDHPSSGRDAYLALALAARATQRLRLFPATSSPVVRHPLVLASLAHSLEEIAPGRTCLTVAPGFISTRSIGQPRAGVGFMRESIRDLRRLLAGEAVGFGPTATRLRNRSATPTPVYLLAAGPRMIELAGEMADGALLFVGLHPAAIRAARRHLEVGAKRAGRSLADFPVAFVVTLGLGADRDAAPSGCEAGSRLAQPFLAYPSVANLHWLGEAGFEVDAGTIPPPSRKIAHSRSPTRSVCSARRNAARSDCCGRTARPALMTCFCSRRTTSPAATPCRRPRFRPSSGSSARGWQDNGPYETSVAAADSWRICSALRGRTYPLPRRPASRINCSIAMASCGRCS